jgi:hypothetical protein
MALSSACVYGGRIGTVLHADRMSTYADGEEGAGQ